MTIRQSLRVGDNGEPSEHHLLIEAGVKKHSAVAYCAHCEWQASYRHADGVELVRFLRERLAEHCFEAHPEEPQIRLDMAERKDEES